MIIESYVAAPAIDTAELEDEDKAFFPDSDDDSEQSTGGKEVRHYSFIYSSAASMGVAPRISISNHRSLRCACAETPT